MVSKFPFSIKSFPGSNGFQVKHEAALNEQKIHASWLNTSAFLGQPPLYHLAGTVSTYVAQMLAILQEFAKGFANSCKESNYVGKPTLGCMSPSIKRKIMSPLHDQVDWFSLKLGITRRPDILEPILK